MARKRKRIRRERPLPEIKLRNRATEFLNNELKRLRVAPKRGDKHQRKGRDQTGSVYYRHLLAELQTR